MRLLHLFIILLGLSVGGAIDCYRCRYSVDEGCDIDMEELKTKQHQVTCDTDCFSQIVKSSTDDSYEIVRDCSYYDTCTEASYTRKGQTYVSRCCTEDLCNADLGDQVFQCFDCEGVDGPDSTCKDKGFMDSDTYSRETSFCGSMCEKSITTDSNGGKVVSRSCKNDCEEGKVTLFGFTTKTYCCSGDICNSASSLKGTAPTLLLILAVSWITLFR